MLIISEFYQTPMTDNEVGEIVKAQSKKLAASSMQQMGAVMAIC